MVGAGCQLEVEDPPHSLPVINLLWPGGGKRIRDRLLGVSQPLCLKSTYSRQVGVPFIFLGGRVGGLH